MIDLGFRPATVKLTAEFRALGSMLSQVLNARHGALMLTIMRSETRRRDLCGLPMDLRSVLARRAAKCSLADGISSLDFSSLRLRLIGGSPLFEAGPLFSTSEKVFVLAVEFGMRRASNLA